MFGDGLVHWAAQVRKVGWVEVSLMGCGLKPILIVLWINSGMLFVVVAASRALVTRKKIGRQKKIVGIICGNINKRQNHGEGLAIYLKEGFVPYKICDLMSDHQFW